MRGKGKTNYTGKLGDVMKESVQAAQSYVHSNATKFGIAPLLFEKKDIHIHVPEGATPKDGPSAGIAMFTAIVSTLTGIPILNDVAMTGEITLRGRVLPIGGLKEKLLAAVRGGIKTVIIPKVPERTLRKRNEKELSEIDKEELISKLEIVFVENASEVLKTALKSKIVPIKWVENDLAISKDNQTSKESAIRH